MTTMLPESSGPNLFSMFSNEGDGTYRVKREAFAASLFGQALVVALLLWLAVVRVPNPPLIAGMSRNLKDVLPVVFAGSGGGGGGSRDVLQASHGAPPKTSLEMQLAPPIVVPNESPKLPVPATVMVAPEVPMPQGNQIGDPTSKALTWLSNGRGGPGGVGDYGCCNGVGPGNGPGVGPGPGGVYTGGIDGVSIPRVIYNPEPSFSEEARKTKTQGIVLLVLVVGADGRPQNIRVQNSLGMGLDERAIAAVNTWRFLPATLRGQPVAAQIAVEVNFHLY